MIKRIEWIARHFENYQIKFKRDKQIYFLSDENFRKLINGMVVAVKLTKKRTRTWATVKEVHNELV